MRIPKLAIAVATVALLAVAPGSALAANSTVTGTVSAGALSLTNNATSSFTATLDGTDQTKNYTIPSVVTDARGNNAGWNLTVTSTQFSTGGGTRALSPPTPRRSPA